MRPLIMAASNTPPSVSATNLDGWGGIEWLRGDLAVVIDLLGRSRSLLASGIQRSPNWTSKVMVPATTAKMIVPAMHDLIIKEMPDRIR